MKIGGRVGFDKIEDLERVFRSVDFPFELALPWKYRELWLPLEERTEEIIDFFRGRKLDILSIHATQGRITEESFLVWGEKTVEIALALGVKSVTVHPNEVKDNRDWHQKQALRMIKRFGGEVTISIETFGSAKRVFTPADLVDQKTPMTLDTAHLPDREEVIKIIRAHHRHIRTVHLSSIGREEHHLPIDDFCVRVVEELKNLGWGGNVILEYLPWHNYRLRDDIRALEGYVAREGSLKTALVDDKYKNQPDRYGFNPDGSF